MSADQGRSQNFSNLSVAGNTTPSLSFPMSIPSSPNPQKGSSRTVSSTSSNIGNGKLKARPIPSSSFNAAFSGSSSNFSTPLQPSTTPSYSALQPSRPNPTSPAPATSGVNYNISLAPQPPAFSPPPPQPTYPTYTPMAPMPPIQPSQPLRPMQPAPAVSQPVNNVKPPPGWSSGVMQPTVAPKPSMPNVANQNWDDFDPLR